MILKNFDVDINDAGTGLMLPNSTAVKSPDFDEEIYGYVHMGEGIHTTNYVNNVWYLLQGAVRDLPFSNGDERKVRAMKIQDTLQEIAMRLARREFPLDTPLPGMPPL